MLESVQLYSFKIRQEINTYLRKTGSIYRVPGSHSLTEPLVWASQQFPALTLLLKLPLIPVSPRRLGRAEFPSSSQGSCWVLPHVSFPGQMGILVWLCCLRDLQHCLKYNSPVFHFPRLTVEVHGKKQFVIC